MICHGAACRLQAANEPARGLLVQLDKAGADGEAHQAGDIVDVEPLHQLGAVGFDGLSTQTKAKGDLLRVVAFGD